MEVLWVWDGVWDSRALLGRWDGYWGEVYPGNAARITME
jgi:hypothetical protein